MFMGASHFLQKSQMRDIDTQYGTPAYVWDISMLRNNANRFTSLQSPFGKTIRYAMKAASNANILRFVYNQGIHIDASSEYEAKRAIMAGIPGTAIQLTSQEFPKQLEELTHAGVLYNATSLYQLEEYGKKFPNTEVSVRINPGVAGGGHNNRTSTGGVSSSFGIWYTYMGDILEIAHRYKLRISMVHTHVGSGADPLIWKQNAKLTVQLLESFPHAHTVSFGGGYKIDRMQPENNANIEDIANALSDELISFYEQTDRKIHMEIEPGTALVAEACALVCQIQDKVDTGDEGYTYLKLNTGMNDLIRPAMYGSQHPIFIMNNANESEAVLLVGHNCESGDIFTPQPDDPEALFPRTLPKAQIGDYVII